MAAADNGKAVLSVADATPHLLLNANGSWGALGQAETLTYSFDVSAPDPAPTTVSGFAQFNAAQMHAAQLAMQSWSDVANIHFQSVSSGYSNNGTIRFADYTSGQDNSAAFTYLPSANADRSVASLQGDVWTNSSLSYNANPTVYGYGQQVLVHEIGHAIGLSHPSDYDSADGGEITYGSDAAFYQDDRQYTVMSYFSENNTGANYAGAYAAAPQLLDIAAAQQMYGPNTSAFLGDTTYGFNSTADRPWFAATSATSPLVFTVWDAGGTDTFDFSGYSQAQTIDLNAGHFSDVGGLTGNVAIAYGASIENAIGGSGADTIIGNTVGNVILGMDGNDSIYGDAGNDDLNGNKGNDTVDGGDGADTVRGGQGDDIVRGGAGDDPHVNGNLGNDTVDGGDGNDTVFGGQGNDSLLGGNGADQLSGDLGNDTMSGGAGADRFVFQHGSGQDVITDFNAAEGDRIQLATGAHYDLETVQGHVLIDLGGGDTIELLGVTQSQLGSSWVVYA